MSGRGFKTLFAAALLATVTVAPALAHPHIFINAKAELIFSGRTLTAIRHTWQFDEAFSAFSVQGLDDNYDGKLSDAELAPLAQTMVKSLVDYAYYTYVTVDQKNIDLAPPKDYRVEWAFGQLTLLMTLPLKMPVEVKSATLQVFDVSYYTAFTFPPKEPFKLTGAPAGCTAAYVPPQQPDTATLLSLYSIPADHRT